MEPSINYVSKISRKTNNEMLVFRKILRTYLTDDRPNDQLDDIIFGRLRQATIYELKSSNEKNENESVIFKTINERRDGT